MLRGAGAAGSAQSFLRLPPVAGSRLGAQLRLGAATDFQCLPASVVRKSIQERGSDCALYFRPWTQATEASTGATVPSARPPGSAALLSQLPPELAVTQAALPFATQATDPSTKAELRVPAVGTVCSPPQLSPPSEVPRTENWFAPRSNTDIIPRPS